MSTTSESQKLSVLFAVSYLVSTFLLNQKKRAVWTVSWEASTFGRRHKICQLVQVTDGKKALIRCLWYFLLLFCLTYCEKLIVLRQYLPMCYAGSLFPFLFLLISPLISEHIIDVKFSANQFLIVSF